MKTLVEEIQDILTPNNSLGLVQENILYRLQPFMPLNVILDMAADLQPAGQLKVVKFLKDKSTAIFNGVVYIKTKGLNFKGRLQEILMIYRDHLKGVIGDKKALIDLYDRLPVEDIVNLIEDHVIFVMKSFVKRSEKGLAAIRYVPTYRVSFNNQIFEFPPCLVAIYIDNNLQIGEPEVIAEGYQYEHPFVFRNINMFGQKICMGTFEHFPINSNLINCALPITLIIFSNKQSKF